MARCETIGVLDLYDTDAHDCPDENLRGARWLADLATAYILLTARLHSAENLATQLQHALIEQGQRHARRVNVDLVQSFSALRSHARNHNLRLTDIAKSVIEGALTPQLDAPAAAPRRIRGRRQRPVRVAKMTRFRAL